MPFITVDLVGNEEVASKFRNMPDKIFNRLGKAMQKLQLDMIRHRRRASDPDQNPSACAPGNDHRLGREPVDSVSVKRSAERRRDQDPARLLPNRLADRHPSAPGRRLCRGSFARLRALAMGVICNIANADLNSLMGISVSDLVALRAVFPVWDAVGHGTERYSHDLYGVVRVPREVAVYLLHNAATSCTTAALGRWRTMIPPRGLHDDH
jgi:hypothetical protein